MIKTKKRKLPKIRRQYHSIVGVDSGLDYSAPSTMIGETFSPRCEEVTFRDKKITKTYGTEYFASTNTTPLTGVVMMAKQFIQNDETEKFLVHTASNVYVYNTSSEIFECITRGEVVENCEDVWAVNANVTVAVDTDFRKGTKSVKLTIAAGFTTGVAAYEDFTSDDFSAQTYLHFYIKSDIATAAADLQLILGDTTAGGTPVGGSDSGRFNIPALVAGVWTEVSIEMTTPGDLGTVESVALYVKVDNGAQVVHIDDVMVTTEMTGDEDNNFVAAVVNDYYVISNGLAPLLYWDMATATFTALLGGTSLAANAMWIIGERLCLYRIPSYPRRVQWTIVGGLSTTPVATDWTASGSGDTDLDSVFGDDVIQTAHKLGNYVVIYGKQTIAMQEYTGSSINDPFSFYVRVAGTGTPSERGVVDLGDKHIILTWDDIVVYKGGTSVESIGDKVSREIFDLINPTYIGRAFMVHLSEEYEIRLYFPLIGSTTPNCYFSYNLQSKSWSRGTRSYTGFGSYKVVATADTWDTIGTATTTWDELTIRWDDVRIERLAPLNIYGDSSGIVYKDNELVTNNAGVAIDGYVDTKDYVIGEGYRRNVTNWMEFNFEATGNTVTVYYSTDLGASWNIGKTFTLTSAWKKYRYDINVNSPQIRFRFRNSTISETFSVREWELGYVRATDRGVA